jgi:hypothetical protein
MPSREEFETARALYEEAVAVYEAAKADLEVLQKDIAETILRGYAPASVTLAEEERLKSKVFAAAALVSKRDRELARIRLD